MDANIKCGTMRAELTSIQNRNEQNFIVANLWKNRKNLLSCQPRVTVTSCFVYTVIRDLESIDHLCINPIRRIGLIHK